MYLIGNVCACNCHTKFLKLISKRKCTATCKGSGKRNSTCPSSYCHIMVLIPYVTLLYRRDPGQNMSEYSMPVVKGVESTSLLKTGQYHVNTYRWQPITSKVFVSQRDVEKSIIVFTQTIIYLTLAIYIGRFLN